VVAAIEFQGFVPFYNCYDVGFSPDGHEPWNFPIDPVALRDYNADELLGDCTVRRQFNQEGLDNRPLLS
jgi:hypothetical protein